MIIVFAAFVLFTIWIPAMLGFLAIEGLQEGVVRARAGAYSRVSDPIWFWVIVTGYAGLVGMFAYIYVWLGKTIL